MPTYEELVAAEQAIRAVLESGAEKRLRAIPGVVHVSVGLKESGGRVTDRHSIRVYVRKKRPDSEVPHGDRIPREIEGVPTDVNVPRKIKFTLDTTRLRPLKGGILIGNKIIGLNPRNNHTQVSAGTFGCTATRTSDGSIVLLTNWHVLTSNDGRIGNPVFQPVPIFPPDLPEAMRPLLPLHPSDETDKIGTILDVAITDHVDGGIARLDLSSCCRCCGLDYRDEINGLSVGGHPPSNNILGQRQVVSGATVYKVGASSGRTVGRVVTGNSEDVQATHEGTDYTLTGQIEIESAPGETVRFGEFGDSGSVIIDDEGFIVGLQFGSLDDYPPDHRTYANHIADVCTALGITINLTTGSAPTAGVRRVADVFIPDEHALEMYGSARARLLADPVGAWMWAVGERHREEVVALVTRRRPVSVAWQRTRGPAFLAETLERLRNGDQALPKVKDGVTLEAALARMADVLAAHGSPALRTEIADHRGALLAAVRDSATLSDLLGELHGVLPSAGVTAGAVDEESAT